MVTWSLRRPIAKGLRGQGIRPINTRTDLPALADLLEAAFSKTMETGGRAVIQQMREAGRLGIPWLSSQGLASGVRRSLVWVEGGRLLGNISIYSADLPHQRGRAWILANIAVLPGQRRRGIATQLVAAALAQLRTYGERHVVLQVDEDNEIARHVYRQAGFGEENVVCLWSRSRQIRPPVVTVDAPSVLRRPRLAWRAEYELAARTRPPERGGISWLRPLEMADFRAGPQALVVQLLAGRWRERRVVMGEKGLLTAALWLEHKLSGPTVLTLLHDEAASEAVLRTLFCWALRRQPYRGAILEHPKEARVSQLLRALDFRLMRTVVNMRLAEVS